MIIMLCPQHEDVCKWLHVYFCTGILVQTRGLSLGSRTTWSGSALVLKILKTWSRTSFKPWKLSDHNPILCLLKLYLVFSVLQSFIIVSRDCNAGLCGSVKLSIDVCVLSLLLSVELYPGMMRWCACLFISFNRKHLSKIFGWQRLSCIQYTRPPSFISCFC